MAEQGLKVSAMPPRGAVAALLVVLLVVVVPLAFFLPVWVLLVFGGCVGWSVRCLRRHLAMPPAWLRILLVMAGVTAILLEFGTIIGRDAGVSLFVLLAGFKLLELRSYRDAMVLLFLGYFLVVTVFLFSQELPVAGFMILVAVALLSVQMALHRRQVEHAWLDLARASGGLLLQAAPMVLVLFLLFPRLEGPLWGLSADSYRGMTGLGDSMTPGNLSELAQSDAVAFRVRFEGTPPGAAQLYWRGPVLGDFDGRTWGLRGAPRQPGPRVVERAAPVTYTMTLEPHNKRWLLALATPARPYGRDAFLSVDGELVSAKPVRQRRRYRLTSHLQTRQDGLATADREAASQLPAAGNRRARALGGQWRVLPPAQRIERALALFRDQPFRYTLRPPRLGQDSVDEFLFDTRRGFCEHYAGAFTFLMRSAGLPARVVTGYQGGEYNPLGDYLIVRQRNAHAWSEVWLDGVGWRRVDPTAVIPPERVELPDENLLGRPSLTGDIALPAGGLVERGARLLTRGLDAINNRWNEWVLGYGGEQQRQFLRDLGLDRLGATGIGLALVGALAGLMLLVAAWLFWRGGSDPVVDAYARFCRRLAQCGLPRRPSEGPFDYCKRVTAARPASAAQVGLITNLYVRLRYQGAESAELLRHLRRQVRRFRPR